jgi:hypothetical protein
MSAHTTGIMKPGVSKVFGSDAFTAVPEGNESKIVAVFGFCGAPDEAESIANAKRFCAVWNACEQIQDPENVAPQLLKANDLILELEPLRIQRNELLEALQNILAVASVRIDDPRIAQWDAARAAIAKAKGGATLWCIHIPGPDEYHAAPSETVANHMAAKHNAAMTEFFKKRPDPDGIGPLPESCMATAMPWPFDAEEHARELSDFDFAAWGLGDPS